MLSEDKGRWLIEDSHQEMVLLVKLLKATIPDLIENRSIDELHTLLDMCISGLDCHLEGIEQGLKQIPIICPKTHPNPFG